MICGIRCSPEQREQWRNARIGGDSNAARVSQPRTDASHLARRASSDAPAILRASTGSQMPGAERSASSAVSFARRAAAAAPADRGPAKHLPACRRRQQRRQQMRPWLGGLVVLVLASARQQWHQPQLGAQGAKQLLTRGLCTERRRGGCLQRADARSGGRSPVGRGADHRGDSAPVWIDERLCRPANCGR